jgi:hypothetical protein
MITQVISIGPFQPFDMILKLANEEQKKRRKSKKEDLFRDATGEGCKMKTSVFLDNF